MGTMQNFRSQKGFGFVQAMIGGGLLIGGALLIVQQMTSSMKVQRQSNLQNSRNELLRTYSSLSRNAVATTNTINAPYNASMKAHVDGSTPMAAGDWSVAADVNAIDFQDIKNNLAIHHDGVIHYGDGALCGHNAGPTKATCSAVRAGWIVFAQWIPLPAGQYEIRILVNPLNPVKDDLDFKSGSSQTIGTASDGDWEFGTGNSIYRNAGEVGIGTLSPQQNLQVTGNIRVAHPTDESLYFMDIVPESPIAGDVYYHFKLKDSAGLDNVSAMTLRGQDGYLGIGTSNPTSLLHLAASANPELRVHNTTNDAIARFYASDDGNIYLLNLLNSNSRITVSENGNVGIGLADGTDPVNKLQVNGSIQSSTNIYASAWITPSDRSLKKNIRKIESVLDLLSQLHAYRYELKANSQNKKRIGIIAQEVQKIFPELVYKNDDGKLGVDYSRLAATVIGAINELNAKLDKSRLSEEKLRSQNLKLKRKIASIENDATKNSKSIESLIEKIDAIEKRQKNNLTK